MFPPYFFNVRFVPLRREKIDPKTLLRYGRLDATTQEALDRFDAFDYLSGEPAQFTHEGRQYNVSVRRCLGSEATNQRRIEVVEDRVRGSDLLAGFIDDLIFSKNRITSGNHGWVGVINYPELYNDVNPVTDLPDEEYLNLMWAYKDMLVKKRGRAVAHRITTLARHSKEIRIERPVNPVTALRSMIKIGGEEGRDYSKDGQVMRKLFEFVSQVAPPETTWQLYRIAHPGTTRKLLSGIPLAKTGYGAMLESAGWQDATLLVTEYEREMPKGLTGNNLETELLSPIVRKVEGLRPSKGWIGLEDRLASL